MNDATPEPLILRNQMMLQLYVGFFQSAMNGFLSSQAFDDVYNSSANIDYRAWLIDKSDEIAVLAIQKFETHVPTPEMVQQAQKGDAAENLIYPNGPRVS